MPAFTGRAVIIEMDSVSIEDQLRTKTIAFNGELVDVTTSGDLGWMTTLDAQFTGRNVTVALEGVLKSTILPTMAFGGTQEPFTVIISNLFQLDATWQFQSGFSIGAPYDGESTFSGTLQSTGVVTKSAAP